MTREIRVMHFADTHFGVELYGRLDPDTGLNTRLKDFKQSLTSAIDTALERGIDLAVFAGDAYKNRDPRQTDQREFAEHPGIKRLFWKFLGRDDFGLLLWEPHRKRQRECERQHQRKRQRLCDG